MTPAVHKLDFYIDRSRVVTRHECPRKRFLTYDYLPEDLLLTPPEEGGIVRATGALPLLNGIAIHAAHARLLAGMGIDEVVERTRTEYSADVSAKGVFGEMDTQGLITEQLAMLEGMLRLWAMWRMPVILRDYELADFGQGPAIEQAWVWELAPGVKQRLRMDAILRRRDDGMLHILDYKSCGAASEGWRQKFEHDLQTELYVQALKERTNEPVGGMLYEGLIKGYYRKDTAKASAYCGQRIQSTPICYAYLLEGQEGQVWSAAYTAKKGFRKVRIIEVMPTKQWVEEHLQYLIEPSDVFIVAPPVCPPPFELERIKKQIANEELRYHQQLFEYRRLLTEGCAGEAEELLDIFAPRIGAACYRYGGENQQHRCSFVDEVCWSVDARPLEDGGFERRQPHHDNQEEPAAV